MSKCKVESGKWKINPFLSGLGGSRAATGGVIIPLFNILFSSPSLVLKAKIEQTDLDKNPAQGLKKQYIEQTQTIPLQMEGLGVVQTLLGLGIALSATWRVTPC